jgi:hypothetical protein
MEKKTALIEQTDAAFNFVEKLYTEVSYLIKQLEGVLAEEDEHFIIGKPSGYGISNHSSSGLDSQMVRLWLMRKFSIFFVEKEKTHIEKGQTVTKLDLGLKILYFRFILHGKDIPEPIIYAGVLTDITKKQQGDWIKKFENIVGNIIEYNDEKAFKTPANIDYSDSYLTFKGKLTEVHLFDINDAEAISTKLAKPALDLYRAVGKSNV